MLIGIDGNEANVEKKVGIGEYAYELLNQFNIQYPISNIKYQIYLKEVPGPEMPKEHERWKYIVVKPKKLWTQVGLPLYLFSHFPRPDIFFTPTHYAPRFSPTPTIISIMDLSFLHFPNLFARKDLYQLTNWTKYSAHNAKRIFTISESSKNDIIKEYSKKPEDIIVTYPGIKSESKTMNKELGKKEIQEKFGIMEEYILFVGTLQPRKNIVRLVEAFAKLRTASKKRSNIQLLVVGKKGWLYDEILESPDKYGVKGMVKFVDFVSDEDLPSIYKHALCFVLPSLYEGFGLPVLEAMKYGCPVVTSNVSSLPEAGGDAALYFDPMDVEDIAQKIKTCLENPKLRLEMIEKGYKNIKRFSWEKTAGKTLEVLEEVANS